MDEVVITLVTLTTWKFISLQITIKPVFCRHVMLIGMEEVTSELTNNTNCYGLQIRFDNSSSPLSVSTGQGYHGILRLAKMGYCI